MIRRAALPLLLALALLAGACGSSSSSSQRTAAGVRETVREFVQDFQHQRYADACALMTKSGQQQIGNGNADACPARLALAMQLVSHDQLNRQVQQALAKLPSAPVSIHGNQATISGTSATGGSSSLVWSGGRWLVGPSSGS